MSVILRANNRQQVFARLRTNHTVTAGRSPFSLAALIWLALLLICASNAGAQTCPDPPSTSGSHSFRQQGESFDIPINLADCQPVALELRWSNGRNNGSNFQVTFLDRDDQPIYVRAISGFLTGNFQFPFGTLEMGSGPLISVPVKATIQAVRPFAAPASISYRVTRVAPRPSAVENQERESRNGEATTENDGKKVGAQTCPDPPSTSGSHSFRQEGESFEIPLNLADCQPVALELRWSNGSNNGANFRVTFLDKDNQPIYVKEISGFLTGNFAFPFGTLVMGSRSLISIPVKAKIQASRPFAAPASISYRVTRVAPRPRPSAVENQERKTGNGDGTPGNDGESVVTRQRTSVNGENVKADGVESARPDRQKKPY